MEIDYLIERLGPYLGGIDVEKVKSILRGGGTAVGRILGVENVEEDVEVVECRRVETFLEMYTREEKRLTSLYRELKAAGVSPSDMATLVKKVREVRRLVRLYSEFVKRCQGRSVSSRLQTPEFTSR
ncbi:MAG: hypothetical protein QXD08_02975 [Pyrobaculum sp.]